MLSTHSSCSNSDGSQEESYCAFPLPPMPTEENLDDTHGIGQIHDLQFSCISCGVTPYMEKDLYTLADATGRIPYASELWPISELCPNEATFDATGHQVVQNRISEMLAGIESPQWKDEVSS
jgi:hypothetical protein